MSFLASAGKSLMAHPTHNKASHHISPVGNLVLLALLALSFSWVLEQGLTLKCNISSGETCSKTTLCVVQMLLKEFT